MDPAKVLEAFQFKLKIRTAENMSQRAEERLAEENLYASKTCANMDDVVGRR